MGAPTCILAPGVPYGPGPAHAGCPSPRRWFRSSGTQGGGGQGRGGELAGEGSTAPPGEGTCWLKSSPPRARLLQPHLPPHVTPPLLLFSRAARAGRGTGWRRHAGKGNCSGPNSNVCRGPPPRHPLFVLVCPQGSLCDDGCSNLDEGCSNQSTHLVTQTQHRVTPLHSMPTLYQADDRCMSTSPAPPPPLTW